MLEYVNRKSVLFLIVSVAVIIVGSIIYYINTKNQELVEEEIFYTEKKINSLNTLYILQLNAAKEKRGYQFTLSEYQLSRYNYYKDSTIKQLDVLSQMLVIQKNIEIYDSIKALINYRFKQFDTHINYIKTLPLKEAHSKIVFDNPEHLYVSEKLESMFAKIIYNLKEKVAELERERNEFRKENNYGFILLIFISITLMILSILNIRKKFIAEREKERIQEINKLIKISEEKYRSIWENTYFGFMLTKPDGTILEVNQAALNMFSYTLDEFRNKKRVEIFDVNDFNYNEFINKLNSEGKAEEEITAIKKSGEKFYVFITSSIFKDHNGDLKTSISIADISEIKVYQIELEEKERKFRGIFNSTFQFIGLLKPDGTVVEANNTALDFASLKLEDVVGKKFWDTYWWQKDNETKEKIKESVLKAANGETVKYEIEVLGKNQKSITILFNIKPIYNKEGIVVALIPEGSPIQEIVDARKALMLKNDELEQFAYIASHDMKEPLRMIFSFLGLLQKRYSDKLDDKGNEYVNYAKDGAERMSRLIDDILLYARTGSEETENEKIDLNVLLDYILKLQSSVIKEKNAVINYSNLPVIYAKKTPIETLFHNLISNALKYQLPDSKPVVNIDCEETENEYLIKISDNGIGINKEYFQKIFTMFGRAVGKSEYPGTGIGLAICKKIVEMHGGKIWVESEAGKGTTFFVTFPI